MKGTCHFLSNILCWQLLYLYIYFFLSFIYYEVGGKKALSKYKYKNRLEKPYKGEGLENTPDDILLSKQGRSY